MLQEPLVQTLRGGSGGGAELSSFGLQVVETYCAIEREAATAVGTG